MLLPEARLEVLLEQLTILPAGDRKAILARLTAPERALIQARLRGTAPSSGPASPYSPDIAERIAAESGITPAARAALAKAVAAAAPEAAQPGAGSLVDTLASRFWPGKGPA